MTEFVENYQHIVRNISVRVANYFLKYFMHFAFSDGFKTIFFENFGVTSGILPIFANFSLSHGKLVGSNVVFPHFG